ncbi:triose-phosphate isomerase [Treponema phagedenis]|uniref:Triosephosphate isomerase n=1 Tax=Treponema phagedenis TaxID=162 RepID=A0A0B7GU76_TREPH|nr:triose-phosphate isomerase [Treponema phagedenis]NVP24695.1 triose-phosphate isomerase [Treponema phagedenis]QEJ95711.1 triose-phosphate isomerase [Treponema phagedenis]QEJ98811.1 triose-phosphate isomerase [Treponema phagedenis]QEK00523.1 triose-phosphate isomerase [Treponema phagedenis]QEK04316.1 triose-phosphate isomerase [Treponema phagedenis]
MRKYFIAGNWKMHKTKAEAVALAKDVVEAVKGGPHKYMIAPSFTALDAVSQVVKNTNVLLGAQNMSTDEQGAHTGEVSVLQLKDLGVQVVILGHSERRHIYKETDEMVNKKVKLALAHGLEVILCIGELLEEREAGKAEQVCEAQTRKGLDGVSKEDLKRVTIAYEPVWAIGTGKTATPEDADAIHAYVRKIIADIYDKDAADSIIIQYGGSMKAENAQALLAKENIDGGLIGGAALKAETFAPIALCK